ncbi:MAG: DUF5320 domain-containing protein [Candidatus Micrarchaeota archaeon]
MPNKDGTGPRWSSGNWRCRNMGYNNCNMTKDEEKSFLVSKVTELQRQIDDLNKRITELS